MIGISALWAGTMVTKGRGESNTTWIGTDTKLVMLYQVVGRMQEYQSGSETHASFCRREKTRNIHSISFLLLLLLLSANPPLFLTLKLVVEEEESLLVRLRCTDDREHPLARLIVRCFRDGNL